MNKKEEQKTVPPFYKYLEQKNSGMYRIDNLSQQALEMTCSACRDPY